MNRYNDRLKFCHRLRAVLPDHFNIVCGAPRYPFIRIDRGESIVGSSDRSVCPQVAEALVRANVMAEVASA